MDVCCYALLPVAPQLEIEEIGKDKIIQISDETLVLFSGVSGEVVEVSAGFFCFNIADGQQSFHGDEIRSPDLIEASRFLCQPYGVSIEAVNKQCFKKPLEMWE